MYEKCLSYIGTEGFQQAALQVYPVLDSSDKRMTIEHAECSIQSTLRALAMSAS